MPFLWQKNWQSVPHVGESLGRNPIQTVHPEQMTKKQLKKWNFNDSHPFSTYWFAVNEMNTPLSKPINIIKKVSDAAHCAILKENESSQIQKNSVYGEDVEAPSDAGNFVITGWNLLLLVGLIKHWNETLVLKEAEKLQQEVDRVEKKYRTRNLWQKSLAAAAEAWPCKRCGLSSTTRSSKLERIATLKKI